MPGPVEASGQLGQVALERVALVSSSAANAFSVGPYQSRKKVDELLGRGEPEREGPLADLERLDPVAEQLAEVVLGAPQHRRRTPARRRHVLADRAKSSPMKPSGVQLASAIVPPGRQTRSSSDAACAWFGANIEPKTEVTASNESSGNGSASASPSTSSRASPSAAARAAAPLEQGRHVVDADGGAAESRGRDRGVAAAGGDVEHAPAGVQVRGSQSCSATSTIRAATTAKSPLAHVCCCRFLIAGKSGVVVSIVLVIRVSFLGQCLRAATLLLSTP